jgi:uncharacterized Fe-S cluster-containing radical SAM superfamily protein
MDEVQEYMTLKKNIADLSDKKIRVEERFKNEKTKLEKIIAEVSAKGYDPKNISEIRKQKQELFKTQVEKLRTQVQETQDKLNLIEV